MSAAVTLSIEVELGWGTHDHGRADHLSEGAREERRYLHALLALCDDLGLPIVFDVVGHLLLESCSGEHPGPYPDGWFEADPGTDASADPEFYAPDAIGAIAEAETDHEIATHTFSHVPAKTLPTSTLAADLTVALETHESVLGQTPVSMVPPRHYRLPAAVLEETDIDVVRYSLGSYEGGPLRRYGELLFGDFPTDEPQVVDGVVETYVTTHTTLTAPTLPGGQRSTHPAFRVLPTSLRQRLHGRRLNRMTRRVIDDGASLHLWTHLWNIANGVQFPVVERYLRTLAAHRDAGQLEVRTMAELGEHQRSATAAAVGGESR